MAASDELVRLRLMEAESTLEAICEGQVDAVVVSGRRGHQIHRLESPDQPFHIFVESMQEGALTLAADGRVLYANAFFTSLLGKPASEIFGALLSSFVVPEDWPGVRALLEGGLGATVKGTCRLIVPDGLAPVQLTLSPLTHAEEPACCAIVFDLRERLAVEQAATARLAAEQANATKDRFLANLSHELRSPLNTVLGWSRILASREDLPESARRAAQTIERNALAQARLISDLLDISRIVAGKLTLEQQTVDFRALVEAAISAARMSVGERDLTLQAELSDEVYVWGDPTRLQQVVTNLLTNAVKFTDAPGTVMVRLWQDSRWVQLEVTDTGVGIGAGQVERIFEPFNQEAGLGRPRRGGLGLGLAIVRQLVQAHGGTIHASSKGVGLGSTFTVRLPGAAAPPVSDRGLTMLRGELAGVSVLVVEDEGDSLDLLRQLLGGAGATVVGVHSAAEALGALAHASFDVLISDIGLPEQDGLGLMREVRARGIETPAIAVTASLGRKTSSLRTLPDSKCT